MDKILIAGGTGFVGKHLITFLGEKGYTIHVLTRNPKPNSSKNIQFFKWDMDRGFIDEKVFEGVTVTSILPVPILAKSDGQHNAKKKS